MRESHKKKKKKKIQKFSIKSLGRNFPLSEETQFEETQFLVEKKLHDSEIIYKTIWVRDQHTSRLTALRMSLEILIKMPFLELIC